MSAVQRETAFGKTKPTQELIQCATKFSPFQGCKIH